MTGRPSIHDPRRSRRPPAGVRDLRVDTRNLRPPGLSLDIFQRGSSPHRLHGAGKTTLLRRSQASSAVRRHDRFGERPQNHAPALQRSSARDRSPGHLPLPKAARFPTHRPRKPVLGAYAPRRSLIRHHPLPNPFPILKERESQKAGTSQRRQHNASHRPRLMSRPDPPPDEPSLGRRPSCKESSTSSERSNNEGTRSSLSNKTPPSPEDRPPSLRPATGRSSWTDSARHYSPTPKSKKPTSVVDGFPFPSSNDSPNKMKERPCPSSPCPTAAQKTESDERRAQSLQPSAPTAKPPPSPAAPRTANPHVTDATFDRPYDADARAGRAWGPGAGPCDGARFDQIRTDRRSNVVPKLTPMKPRSVAIQIAHPTC